MRPKYLNLFRIRMPVTAVVSIAHRISGFLLVLCIPVFLFSLQASLENAQSYNSLLQYISKPTTQCFLVLIIWAIVHHLVAGIRFLLIDIDIGVSKTIARGSAWSVHIIAIVFTLYIAWRMV